MRTGSGFNADGPPALFSSPPSSPGGAAAHSGWRSPVPFLFGSMAAMLGLVALALIILTCSYYWNSLSGDDSDSDSDRQKTRDSDGAKGPAFLEDSFLVVMPGDVAPTALAIPIPAPQSGQPAALVPGDLPVDRQTPPQSH